MNTTSALVVLPLEISTPIAGNYTIELEGLLSNGVYSEAYLVNNTTKEQLEIGDANSVSLYFEKGETNNSYSLVLKKANVPFNFNGENVSIFSTADFINIKGNFETAQTVKVEVYNIVGQLVMNTTTELLPNDRITLSTADLQSEVYVIKVTTSNNQQFTNKIVVAK
ncbi:MAG: T9SS type A sorting domain-containing protein [Bacteroidetes bacterium]|nr:T9SS type A sorting domain-containing protein [Bacteroidota bacterium]